MDLNGNECCLDLLWPEVVGTLMWYLIIQFVYDAFWDRKIIPHTQTVEIIQNMKVRSRVAPLHFKIWDSNLQPSSHKSITQPTELQGLLCCPIDSPSGCRRSQVLSPAATLRGGMAAMVTEMNGCYSRIYIHVWINANDCACMIVSYPEVQCNQTTFLLLRMRIHINFNFQSKVFLKAKLKSKLNTLALMWRHCWW